MKRKILALLLCIVMVLGVLPVGAWAAENSEKSNSLFASPIYDEKQGGAGGVSASGMCGQNLRWEYREKYGYGLLVVVGEGEMDNYLYAKDEHRWKYAPIFYLDMVVLDQGVTSIGDYAFAEVKNAVFNIPASVVEIGDYSFDQCSDIEIYYNGSADEWEKITVGAGNEALSTAVIHYDSYCGIYGSVQGCVLWTFVDGLLTVFGTGEMGRGGGNSVESGWRRDEWEMMSNHLFRDIQEVVIQEGITTIGCSAFERCDSLEKVTLPASITTIESYAFRFCNNLSDILIPEGVISIGDNVFQGCSSLESIIVDDENLAFCSIDGVLFTKDISTLIVCPSGKAGECLIPAKVVSIEDNAFYSCINLSEILVETGNLNYTSYDGVLFNKDMTILLACPAGRTEDFIVPEGTKEIQSGAFSGCTFENITLSSSVEEISTSLRNVEFSNIYVATNNHLYSSIEGVLCNKEGTTILRFPAGRNGKYNIPSGVIEIGDNAFSLCREITEIIVPDGVVSIGNSAFYFCDMLADISLPDSVSEIGKFAFGSCYNLNSIIVPKGVTTIREWVFHGTYLESIVIPSSVTTIKQMAFSFDSPDLFQYLQDIYYTGSEEQWNAIEIDENGNEELFGATIHYNYIYEYKSEEVTAKTTPNTFSDTVTFHAAPVPPTAINTGNLDPETSLIYDLYFEQGGERVQPSGTVTVSIPVPGGMDGEKCVVYFVDENGSLTDMKATFQDGCMVFTTDHFSYYAISAEKIASSITSLVAAPTSAAVTLANPEAGMVLYLASYTDDGRMVEIFTQTVEAGKTEYSFTLSGAGSYVKAFLTDADAKPLCDPMSSR